MDVRDVTLFLQNETLDINITFDVPRPMEGLKRIDFDLGRKKDSF